MSRLKSINPVKIVYLLREKAEVFAILNCALRRLEKDYHGKRILILTDSRSALETLSSNQASTAVGTEASGMQGNENAGQLAKMKRKEKCSCINYWAWSLQENLRTVRLYKEEPICQMCKQEEKIVSHILFECAFLETKRFSLSSKEKILEDNASVDSNGDAQ
ncbi:hypothetical protein ANN_14943 [Periplaneta americana]|uniref:Reverse transcriptase zinc-binding domain-containing protein n=1 Tax=Periplaneta americana TaxID=6978 RepID=A0ABQ8SXP2_PERAM|nr:hypothetical protein ANN_14943 [Periplaneta americana]